MINNKILLWGAKSIEAPMLIYKIGNKEVSLNGKKLTKNKILYLIDPFLNQPEFKTKIPFINSKKKFNEIIRKVNSFVVSNGHGMTRTLIAKKLMKLDLKPLSLISNSSYLDKSSKFGKGNIIMPNSTVHCFTKIGNFNVLNTACTIDHDCEIGDGVHVMGGAAIAGGVKIGNYVSIGTNATILPGVKIEDGAYVGAGAVVRKNVNKNDVVVGNPARMIKKNTHESDLSFFD